MFLFSCDETYSNSIILIKTTSAASAVEGSGNTSPSFGARFNKVPTRVLTQGCSLTAAPAITPLMSTHGVGELPQVSETREHFKPHQTTQLPHSHLGEQLCQPSDWRKLPQPTQMGPLTQQSQMALLPSLSSMFTHVNAKKNPHCQQHQPYPNGRQNWILNADHTMPMSDAYCHHSADNGPVNPHALCANKIVPPYRFCRAEAIGEVMTRPDRQPGQPKLGEEEPTRLHNGAQSPAKHNADKFARSVDSDTDHEQRKLRKALLQFKREQAEFSSGYCEQSEQQNVGQEAAFHCPLVETNYPPTSTLFPFNQRLQQSQPVENLQSRNDTPTPPLGPFHPHKHLQSSGR